MQVPQEIKKAPLWMKLLVIGGIILVAAPLTFWVLKGIATIAALGGAAVLVLIGINFGPVLAEKLANMGLQARKKEWAQNPIPTLQRQYGEKVDALKERKNNLKIFIASVDTVRQNNDVYKERFPANVDKVKALELTYQKLMRLQALKMSKYEVAKQAVAKFAIAIEEADLFWKAAMAANSAAAMDDADTDPMEMLKTQTSLGSVQEQLGIAFSELDVALLDQVNDDHGIVIDITPQIPLKVPVK